MGLWMLSGSATNSLTWSDSNHWTEERCQPVGKQAKHLELHWNSDVLMMSFVAEAISHQLWQNNVGFYKEGIKEWCPPLLNLLSLVINMSHSLICGSRCDLLNTHFHLQRRLVSHSDRKCHQAKLLNRRQTCLYFLSICHGINAPFHLKHSLAGWVHETLKVSNPNNFSCVWSIQI